MRIINGLLINHKGVHCGVYQFGHALTRLLSRDKRINWAGAECADGSELQAVLRTTRPDITIFNSHPSTMAWLGPLHFRGLAGVTFGVQHGISQSIADQIQTDFDFVICLDPTIIPRHPKAVRVPRFMPSEPLYPSDPPEIFTIGSFGFATPGKGFDRICRLASEQFSTATVRLNIAMHDSADIVSDQQLQDVVAACRKAVTNPGIDLQITHDFMDAEATIRFLSQHSINAFLYDDAPDNGISSCVDFAMASGRPIAVTKSSMFRHLWSANPSIFIEDRTIEEIARSSTVFSLSEHKHSIPSNAAKSWTDELVLAYERYHAAASTPDGKGFNKILDDRSRQAYKDQISRIAAIAPDMVKRKVERANVQQAFGFDIVQREFNNRLDAKVLAIGSYEDTAVATLKRLGFCFDEVDPIVNGRTLLDYYMLHPERLSTYDIVLCISVLGHVEDDKNFVRIAREFLRPGGIAVFTLDFRERQKSVEADFPTNFRFYNTSSIVDGLMRELSDCVLMDNPSWSEGTEDFTYEGHTYGLAGFVFRRLDQRSIELAEVQPAWHDIIDGSILRENERLKSELKNKRGSWLFWRRKH